MTIKWAAGVGILLWAGAAWSAGMPDDSAKRFGMREAVQEISLSPDGTHVAVMVPSGTRGQFLMVADLTKEGVLKPVLSASGDNDDMGGCQWPTAVRLVCTVRVRQKYGNGYIGLTRLVTLDSDGRNVKELTVEASGRALGFLQQGGGIIDLGGDGGGAVLVTRQFVAESGTGTHVASSSSGFGVDAVDVMTLKRRTVERPNPQAREYISDGRGTVRIMGLYPRSNTGYDADHVDYMYRATGSREWKTLSRLTLNGALGAGFDPYAVDPDKNLAYGFDADGHHRALYSIALDGSLKRNLVISRPDVDIDRLISIGRQQRVVGVSFVTDRRQTQFFDPDLKKLQASLGRALPEGTLVTFVDVSADEKKLLLFAGSDVDPGAYYLLDRTTHRLAEVLKVRPALGDIKLAAVKAITYKAADGTAIPAYLTLPPGSDGRNLPAIVMPHGGPWARDEWGFDWLVQFFAHRGYAVLQPQFRGSSGYGDQWFQKNGFQSWRVAVGDVDDAGRYLLSSGIAAPDKLAIVGWSYGGYAALQSGVLNPDLFKAIIAIAPVTDLTMLKAEARDFTSYRSVASAIGSGPHIRQGSPLQNVAAIKAPVLIFHGDRDMNVNVQESRAMAAKLKAAEKPATYVEFKGLAHQLDDDAARAELLGKSDAFLRASLHL